MDELIKSSLATVQMGVAKADGKLSLTTTALSFVPFNAQLGLGPYHFQRDTIISVEPAVGKGGGPYLSLRWFLSWISKGRVSLRYRCSCLEYSSLKQSSGKRGRTRRTRRGRRKV